ncbi:MAG: response regulator [Clostridiales Family XIII bacterium]|jgi:CheY-like chemotaxis protein|nr:response regulator [Clostridiales Family XIII bacterium]
MEKLIPTNQDDNNKRVLVVDDVKINLVIAKKLMRPHGLTVDCVTSGADAIHLIRDSDIHYDAIFMDYLMPRMDGVEAMRMIREQIETDYARTIPIIALTAHTAIGRKEKLISYGFQDFIAKPIDSARLDEVLCKIY